RPGAVNWMSAGRGIAHSERTAPDHRVAGEPLHGLQCWVALPATDEEGAPAFVHHDAGELPTATGEGKTVRVVAGRFLGMNSPVGTGWAPPLADATRAAGASLPLDADTEERALYIVSGDIEIAGDRFEAGRLLVFRPGDRIPVPALTPARLGIVGGA